MLSEFTTLRVGGPARELLSPQTHGDLIRTVLDVWESGEPWLLIGGGSNLLIADEGFDGTVIRILTRGIEQLPDPEALEGSHTILRVQAGESWDAVVQYAVANGLTGIEALSGIPGSAGAAPVQNIGAYGQELSAVLDSVEFLDANEREVVRLSAADLELGYRTSTLKRGRLGVVVSLDLRLERGDLSAPVAYDQLASALGVPVGERAPRADVRKAVLALRSSKGMVLDPADPDSVSAGSFFTNPIVTENFARGLRDAPKWILDPDAPDSPVKLSAAWLIEHAGIKRGFSLPGSGAAVSRKHTLAIVNTGAATAADIAELARYVHVRVLSQFGVKLQPEPQFVGVSI
jgi:UDP-N-acetylmuramate dehydrogenase